MKHHIVQKHSDNYLSTWFTTSSSRFPFSARLSYSLVKNSNIFSVIKIKNVVNAYFHLTAASTSAPFSSSSAASKAASESCWKSSLLELPSAEKMHYYLRIYNVCRNRKFQFYTKDPSYFHCRDAVGGDGALNQHHPDQKSFFF